MEKKNRKHFYSIRLRIFVILLFVTFLIMGGSQYIIYNSFRNYTLQNRQDKVLKQCVVLINQIVESGAVYTGVAGRVTDSVQQMANDYNGRAVFTDSMGKAIMDTSEVDTGLFITDSLVLKALDGKTSTIWDYDNMVMMTVLPIKNSISDKILGTLIFSATMNDISTLMMRVQKVIVGVDVVLLTTVVIVLIFILVYMGRPFTKMKKSIDLISDGSNKKIEPQNYKETKEIIETMNELLEHMDQQDQLRQQFVSNVSHELKTPITSMRVLADSLIGMPDAPKEIYQEFMQDISSEIDREAKIISDLLELVRMDNSAVKLSVSVVNINDWLQDLLHRLVPIANKQNVELVMESFRDVVAQIDPSKLSLAISNLVENAIKYNVPKGYVHVSLNADHKFFYIKVEDNGVGIPEDAMDKIFDRFYRVDKARSRDAGGTGLGLAITKSVIQMHRGVIRVYSKVGEGTTFSVRLPLNYKDNSKEAKG